MLWKIHDRRGTSVNSSHFSLIADNTLAVASLNGGLGGDANLGQIFGALIGGMMLGVFLAMAILILCLRRQGGQLDLGQLGSIGGSKPRIPSSPHYLSAKQQNHYVSMGSLDWKKTNAVDDSGHGSSSTLPSRGLRPPPLRITNSSSVGVSTDSYPTATIKRNSGGHNQMRTNIEADHIF